MPPFAGPPLQKTQFCHPKRETPNIITLNVGGQIFQTSPQTLTLAGPNSLLCTLTTSSLGSIPFIDRDPDLFSILLTLLRTGTLPSRAKVLDPEDLIHEAQFYNIEHLLISAITDPSSFYPLNLQKTLILPINGRDSPSAIATHQDGSVLVSHGSKITAFDWSLRRKTSFLTEFPAIDSLLFLSPSVAAAGASDYSGVKILDINSGLGIKTLNWDNPIYSTVQAIGASPEFLFASFESCRKNSNLIQVFDRESFRPLIDLGHEEKQGVEIGSAIPATKLNWVSSQALLMASGSYSGPFGCVGSIKLWDIRSGSRVAEIKENEDCFADVTVNDGIWGLFKVGLVSGEVYMMDLRRLGSSERWVSLGEGCSKVMNGNGKREGVNSKIVGHGNSVFCSRGENVEVWSEVLMGGKEKEGVFRKNVMGRREKVGQSKITQLDFGGNRMVLARKDEQAIEVWQGSGTNFVNWGWN
ncbi:hypothetical protein AMTRI_Chr07g30070 [Amborella trichopoda]|uniref:BTB domain-containing protein n=1 Tax=Amborella trichopoda TaxID=13333 RepID=W1NGQ8_AMBTC|nr:BTB/POZ domain-containing protein At5g41330 [Amborella trichopoda]ERM94987.1 hypothetical protein AMTR_s00009p00225120 [Amborella trichopoda]|eukprot:XP_006827571.1 BTB/POZ domain-containing protein At5g41330 [Amborella trichopoda]